MITTTCCDLIFSYFGSTVPAPVSLPAVPHANVIVIFLSLLTFFLHVSFCFHFASFCFYTHTTFHVCHSVFHFSNHSLALCLFFSLDCLYSLWLCVWYLINLSRSLSLSFSIAWLTHYYPLSINLQNLISGWMRQRTAPHHLYSPAGSHLASVLSHTHTHSGRVRERDFSPLSAFCNYISAVLHFAGHSTPALPLLLLFLSLSLLLLLLLLLLLIKFI